MWGVNSPLIFMNISNISKFFSICLILIVFAFLVNNYLTFAGDWPIKIKQIEKNLEIFEIFIKKSGE